MREVRLLNRQRVQRINTKLLRAKTVELLEEILRLERFSLAIHLVGAARMAKINQQFLEHKGSTDVITFDYREGYDDTGLSNLDLSGEVFISIGDAMQQAREFATTWQEELLRYIVHAALHLRGYDDQTSKERSVMKREENRLLRAWRNRVSLEEISR